MPDWHFLFEGVGNGIIQKKEEIFSELPKVLEYKGYKFFFFSNEGNPLEPSHIHFKVEVA